MKQLNIFGALIFIILTALSFSNPINETFPSDTSKQVISIHQIELKENIDPNEFETFVFTEMVPLYDRIKGLQLALAKGDRGSRTNKYAMILTFDSIEDRNRIFPHDGESPEDWGDDKIWGKLFSMSSGFGEDSSFTDYVCISQ
ncbi:MAG: hypothetical protein HRU41_40105 [Saprospiraceae bacterium]|nr:hypothetical protein [Saprospiraceae bacterium]